MIEWPCEALIKLPSSEMVKRFLSLVTTTSSINSRVSGVLDFAISSSIESHPSESSLAAIVSGLCLRIRERNLLVFTILLFMRADLDKAGNCGKLFSGVTAGWVCAVSNLTRNRDL